MVYELTEGVVKYEFCIHAIDEIFLDKMTVKDLLNLKRIAFFKHTIYMKDNDGCWQREAFKMYVKENDYDLN
jgi:hypothetical protein